MHFYELFFIAKVSLKVPPSIKVHKNTSTTTQSHHKLKFVDLRAFLIKTKENSPKLKSSCQ